MQKKYIVKTLSKDMRGGDALFDTPEAARAFYDRAVEFLKDTDVVVSKEVRDVQL